ncbi:uncharacterized protein LOC144159179 isoform X2 [Haemaphysalis longicornis]
MDGQHEDTFSYQLRSLQELREAVEFAEDNQTIILPRHQNTVYGSSREEAGLSDVTYTPDPVDSLEEIRSPASPTEPAMTPASPVSPASLISPALLSSPDALKGSRAGSLSSQADLALYHAHRGLGRHSSFERSLSIDSITSNGKDLEAAKRKKREKKTKHHHRRSPAPNPRNSLAFDWKAFATSLLPSEVPISAGTNPQDWGEVNAEVPISEGMHASLDRLSKIFNEMALLLNTTVYQQRRDEGSCLTESLTPATATEHGMSSQTSSQPEREVHESTMSSGEVLSPEASAEVRGQDWRSRRRSRHHSFRDVAPSSSSEHSPEMGKKGGNHLKPQRHGGGSNKRFVRSAKDALPDSSEEDEDVTITDDVPDSGPSRPAVRTDSAPSRRRDRQSSSAANRRAYNALIAGRFPPLQTNTMQSLPSLPGDDREANRRASEVASVGQACRSPGEMPDNMFTELIDYNPEAGAPEGHSEGELEPESRHPARGVRWFDRGRFSNEVYRADVTASAPDDTRGPRTWLPLQQSARETGPSQHIWRYADSYSDRVYDEAAQRRAEVHRTSFGGNIFGQPPHMRASRVRLASYPAGRGKRMCEVKIVGIITPIRDEEATASSSSDAGVAAARPPGSPQARPP